MTSRKNLSKFLYLGGQKTEIKIKKLYLFLLETLNLTT